MPFNTATLRMRGMLRRLSDEELHAKFQTDLFAGKGTGMPMSTSYLAPEVAKALSGNTNGQVLVRQDLEPVLRS